MKKIIIIGLSEFSEWVYRLIVKEKQGEVCAFSIQKEYLSQCYYLGIPVVALEELSTMFDMSQCVVLNTIGYSQMNDVRRKIYQMTNDMGYKQYTFVSRQAFVDTDDIGEGSIVMPGAFVGPNVSLGKCVIVNDCANISHNIKIGDFTFVAGSAVVGGNVTIGDNCFIGLNATIVNGVCIGDYVLIGAATFICDSLTSGRSVLEKASPVITKLTSKEIINLV